MLALNDWVGSFFNWLFLNFLFYLFGFFVIKVFVFGFVFFFTIPYANTALDYLVRSNLERSAEGSIWGAVGFVSQTGYVFSYALSGLVSDSVAKAFDVSVGRGCALVISGGGVLLALLALALLSFDSVRKLEHV